MGEHITYMHAGDSSLGVCYSDEWNDRLDDPPAGPVLVMSTGDTIVLDGTPAELLALADRIREAVNPAPVPAVVVHDEDGRPVDLVCPCGGAIVEHDGAERWNPVSYEPADGELRHGIVVHQGQDDFHTIAFECESCRREVELPEGIVVDWI